MADDGTVSVRLMIGAREGRAGETVEVTPGRARELVERAGAGRYATKPDARAASGPEAADDPLQTDTA